jgi:hypothetical protein
MKQYLSDMTDDGDAMMDFIDIIMELEIITEYWWVNEPLINTFSVLATIERRGLRYDVK